MRLKEFYFIKRKEFQKILGILTCQSEATGNLSNELKNFKISMCSEQTNKKINKFVYIKFHSDKISKKKMKIYPTHFNSLQGKYRRKHITHQKHENKENNILWRFIVAQHQHPHHHHRSLEFTTNTRENANRSKGKHTDNGYSIVYKIPGVANKEYFFH